MSAVFAGHPSVFKSCAVLNVTFVLVYRHIAVMMSQTFSAPNPHRVPRTRSVLENLPAGVTHVRPTGAPAASVAGSQPAAAGAPRGVSQTVSREVPAGSRGGSVSAAGTMPRVREWLADTQEDISGAGGSQHSYEVDSHGIEAISATSSGSLFSSSVDGSKLSAGKVAGESFVAKAMRAKAAQRAGLTENNSVSPAASLEAVLASPPAALEAKIQAPRDLQPLVPAPPAARVTAAGGDARAPASVPTVAAPASWPRTSVAATGGPADGGIRASLPVAGVAVEPRPVVLSHRPASVASPVHGAEELETPTGVCKGDKRGILAPFSSRAGSVFDMEDMKAALQFDPQAAKIERLERTIETIHGVCKDERLRVGGVVTDDIKRFEGLVYTFDRFTSFSMECYHQNLELREQYQAQGDYVEQIRRELSQKSALYEELGERYKGLLYEQAQVVKKSQELKMEHMRTVSRLEHAEQRNEDLVRMNEELLVRITELEANPSHTTTKLYHQVHVHQDLEKVVKPVGRNFGDLNQISLEQALRALNVDQLNARAAEELDSDSLLGEEAVPVLQAQPSLDVTGADQALAAEAQRQLPGPARFPRVNDFEDENEFQSRKVAEKLLQEWDYALNMEGAESLGSALIKICTMDRTMRQMLPNIICDLNREWYRAFRSREKEFYYFSSEAVEQIFGMVQIKPVNYEDLKLKQFLAGRVQMRYSAVPDGPPYDYVDTFDNTPNAFETDSFFRCANSAYLRWNTGCSKNVKDLIEDIPNLEELLSA